LRITPEFSLLARSAFCDVTPRGRPVNLAGYASRPAATVVLDPIEISAVLLEAGGRRCLIISFDLMIVGAELQAAIHARLVQRGFRPDEIFLLASHTHFAPATDRACAPLGEPDEPFVRDVAAATDELMHRMLQAEPWEIELEIRRGRLKHAIHRRRFWPFPTLSRTYGFRLSCMALAPDPGGKTDETATVILLRRSDNAETVGAIWHYACHATAVTPYDVISADFPGTVRRALRQRLGDIPVIFVQGFCGDINPDIVPSKPPHGVLPLLRGLKRMLIAGPSFPAITHDDWKRWSDSLAEGVLRIATQPAENSIRPATLVTGAAKLPLEAFFKGSAPDKPLVVQVLALGDDLELVALSAEATFGWHAILDRQIPPRDGQLRLYAGYLGALYGYLPTKEQIREGGYEVEGFQPLFCLSGHFDTEKITPAVVDCVKRAVDDLTSTT
jgi:hypothetical protein